MNRFFEFFFNIFISIWGVIPQIWQGISDIIQTLATGILSVIQVIGNIISFIFGLFGG